MLLGASQIIHFYAARVGNLSIHTFSVLSDRADCIGSEYATTGIIEGSPTFSSYFFKI